MKHTIKFTYRVSRQTHLDQTFEGTKEEAVAFAIGFVEARAYSVETDTASYTYEITTEPKKCFIAVDWDGDGARGRTAEEARAKYISVFRTSCDHGRDLPTVVVVETTVPEGCDV